MRADRPVRLPLQLGTSALFSLARGAAFAVPGLVLFTLGLAVLWTFRDAFSDSGDAGGYIVLAIMAPGVLTTKFAYKHLRRAHRERPSDLLVTRDGVEVRGGPHHRETFAWAAIDAVRIDTPNKPANDLETIDDSDLRIVTVVCRDPARELQLASADRPAEQQSLVELADTLRAAAHAPTRDEQATPAVKLFACAGCGAALAPADATTVTCANCEHATTVPDELRATVRDARALQARPDRAIAQLLDQPSAGAVGALYVAAAMFMLVAWPVAALMMYFEFRLGQLTALHVVCLVGFVGSCIAGLYALLRGRLVDRQALRLVAVDFAAIEPATVGEPYRCQHCLAPLPALAADEVLVRCAYCNADNVLGLHLGRAASIARQEAHSLTAALARRRLERRRWRGVSIAAVVLLVGAWLSFRHGVR